MEKVTLVCNASAALGEHVAQPPIREDGVPDADIQTTTVSNSGGSPLLFTAPSDASTTMACKWQLYILEPRSPGRIPVII